MEKLAALWRGEVCLKDAFWTWAVLGGLLVNIMTSILFLILMTMDEPWPALIIGYALPLPYNLLALVGVWRSAARYDGPERNADMARIATVALLAVLSAT